MAPVVAVEDGVEEVLAVSEGAVFVDEEDLGAIEGVVEVDEDLKIE